MFKLGRYDEDDARNIANYLKEAGIRIELRPFICSDVQTTEYMVGRLSEFEGVVEEYDDYVEYLKIMKKVLAEDITPMEFEDRFFSELDPLWEERKEILHENLGDWLTSDLGPRGESTKEAIEGIKTLFRFVKASTFITSVFERNEIKIGENIEEMLDDPMIHVPVDSDDLDPDNELFRMDVTVDFEKYFDLFIDEFNAPLIEDVDAMFEVEYPKERFEINMLGMLILDLLEPPESSRRMDFDDFKEALVYELKMEKSTLEIDGWEVAEDIAKVLEKNGVLKIKGNTIKWKKMDR
jgi:hypothetical protein